MHLFIFLISFLLNFTSTEVWAQSGLEGFPSGRWEIRKEKKQIKTEQSRKPAAASPEANAEQSVPTNNSSADSTTKPAAAAELQQSHFPKNIPHIVNSNITEPTPQDIGVYDQIKIMFSEHGEKLNESFKAKLELEDPRRNKIEIEFAPSLVYNDSKSNYSFRSYQSFFEAMKFKANLWFTSMVGISSNVMLSMGADLDDTAQSRVTNKYENIDLGLNYRKFFGLSKDASSISVSFIISDNSMKVSSDSHLHPRLKSTGYGLGLNARLPTSPNYAWILGGAFFPQIQHSESATSVNAGSGTADSSVRASLNIGGEWNFTRKSTLVLDLSSSTERNLFTGSANLPDSNTGVTPKNVSATNSLYMFSLGYRWGH
jgi:hypothetical protein